MAASNREREITMANTLTLTLQTQVLKEQATVAGIEQYEGGELHEGNRCVGTFAATRNTIAGVTDAQNLDTAMVVMTLFFFAQQHHGGGGGGGAQRGQAPENITLEGATEFQGQPHQGNQVRQPLQDIGSVSAASPAWSQLKDKQFVRQGNQLRIG
jgi:hypothetical protein